MAVLSSPISRLMYHRGNVSASMEWTARPVEHTPAAIPV